MVLTRELLVRMKRYLSVPAALVLSVALRSVLARLSVPWSVHWGDAAAQGAGRRTKQMEGANSALRAAPAWIAGTARDASVSNLAGLAGGSPERAVGRYGEVRLDLRPRRHQRDHLLAVAAEARPGRLAR